MSDVQRRDNAGRQADNTASSHTLLEGRLGYQLESALLVRALTHRSYAYENGGLPTNERLEFLGDSVLGLVVTDTLYRTHPDLPEGQLAKLRAAVVNSRALAEVGRGLELGSFIRLGRGEEGTGGRDKASILADTLEAVIGAVYLDQGLDAASELVHRLFDPLIEKSSNLGAGLDWKTSLQELTATEGLGVPGVPGHGDRPGPREDLHCCRPRRWCLVRHRHRPQQEGSGAAGGGVRLARDPRRGGRADRGGRPRPPLPRPAEAPSDAGPAEDGGAPTPADPAPAAPDRLSCRRSPAPRRAPVSQGPARARFPGAGTLAAASPAASGGAPCPSCPRSKSYGGDWSAGWPAGPSPTSRCCTRGPSAAISPAATDFAAPARRGTASAMPQPARQVPVAARWRTPDLSVLGAPRDERPAARAAARTRRREAPADPGPLRGRRSAPSCASSTSAPSAGCRCTTTPPTGCPTSSRTSPATPSTRCSTTEAFHQALRAQADDDQAGPARPVADQRGRQHLRGRGAVAGAAPLRAPHRRLHPPPHRRTPRPCTGRDERGPRRRRHQLRQPVRQRERRVGLLRPLARRLRTRGTSPAGAAARRCGAGRG